MRICFPPTRPDTVLPRPTTGRAIPGRSCRRTSGPSARWRTASPCGGDRGRPAKGYDLFFNLCTGPRTGHPRDRGGPGPGARRRGLHGRHVVLRADRQQMKDACASVGVATPGCWSRTTRASGAAALPARERHAATPASTSAGAPVTVAGLRQQVRKIGHGAALVEEYVDGPECAVWWANPDDVAITYTPSASVPPGVLQALKLKWQDYDGLVRRRGRGPRAAPARGRGLFSARSEAPASALRRAPRRGRRPAHAGDQRQLRRVLPAHGPRPRTSSPHDPAGHGFNAASCAALSRRRVDLAPPGGRPRLPARF